MDPQIEIDKTFLAQCEKAGIIFDVLFETLNKQHGKRIADSYVNRVRVFDMFLKHGSFQANKGRKIIRSGNMRKFVGLGPNKEHPTDTGYAKIVKEMMKGGLLKKVGDNQVAANIDTLIRVNTILNDDKHKGLLAEDYKPAGTHPIGTHPKKKK